MRASFLLPSPCSSAEKPHMCAYVLRRKRTGTGRIRKGRVGKVSFRAPSRVWSCRSTVGTSKVARSLRSLLPVGVGLVG